MVKQRNALIALISALVCLFAAQSFAHKGATGIVKERMDKFSEARGQMKQIRGALQANSLDIVVEITSDMRQWATDMPHAFPAGSDMAPSEALPAIWDDKDGFAQAIAAYDEAIIALQKAALSNDQTNALDKFRALGQACSNCHKSYRK